MHCLSSEEPDDGSFDPDHLLVASADGIPVLIRPQAVQCLLRISGGRGEGIEGGAGGVNCRADGP